MFEQTKYYDKIYEYDILERMIKRKNAAKDIKTVEQRTQNIIQLYNDIITLTKPVFESKTNNALKATLRERSIYMRDRMIQNLGILNRTDIKVPTNLTETIKYKVKEKEGEKSNDNKVSNIEISDKKEIKMATEKFQYLSSISKIVSSTYKGDPNGLNAFVTALELADSSSTEAQQETLIKFVKTKLQGKALECIPEEISNVKEIIHALKRKIKPESSKIVLGRFLSLRGERNNFTDFQKQAEELSDALNRAYISEGMSQKLAETMTIDKTVEMCRLSAKTALVKSILASTSFKEPKEVVAKLITESTMETNESQILYFNNNSQRKGHSNNFTNTNRYFRGNRNNNFRGNNFRGQNRFNGYNNRGRSQNSNFRGRGNRRFNNSNRGGDNKNHYVRVVNQENEEAPTSQRGQVETVTMNERRN